MFPLREIQRGGFTFAADAGPIPGHRLGDRLPGSRRPSRVTSSSSLQSAPPPMRLTGNSMTGRLSSVTPGLFFLQLLPHFGFGNFAGPLQEVEIAAAIGLRHTLRIERHV